MTLSRTKSEFHRKTAIECFNRAWDYLDAKERTSKDNQEMLNLVHASRYHWGLVGTATNLAVGDWQISRAYADLGQPQLALQFAESCLETCQKNGLEDIMHTASEAMARAYAVAKDYTRARKYLSTARKQLDELTLSKEDRQSYLDQIRKTERLTKA